LIITKTPLRVPFAGGLSDLKPYVDRFGGVTVSSTIDKYIYVFLKKSMNGFYDLKYLDVHEKTTSVDKIEHDLIREAIRLTGLESVHLDIVVMDDLTTESGLGSSGAVTIGILQALHAYKRERIDAIQLFKEASSIEVDILEGASGYHDPAISALGGFRIIEYLPGGLESRKLSMSSDMRERFASSLLFFYSGVHNKSKPSLHLLMSQLDSALPIIHRIKEIGYEIADAFESGDLATAARIIGEQQELKQRLPGNFYDSYVESIGRRVRKHGAFAQLPGGKVSAFVIVCCPDGQHEAVRREFSDYEEVPVRLVDEGSIISEI
jgi:D-glycero-alpha-D-manno-heptose-7-phosphate kinase